jgi:hypothetical protein
MNKSKNILRAVIIMTILIGGTNSFSISARRRDSFLQNKCRGVLRMALMGGKGFIAVYSGYKALKESALIISIFQELVKHPANRTLGGLEHLLYIGCITSGLAMLSIYSGKSFADDLE